MFFRDELKLIGENPAAHGVFEQYAPTERTVFCSVRSVGMSESYQALSYGLHPQFVFTLSDYTDYQGEKICEYKGTRYRIVRTDRKSVV